MRKGCQISTDSGSNFWNFPYNNNINEIFFVYVLFTVYTQQPARNGYDKSYKNPSALPTQRTSWIITTTSRGSRRLTPIGSETERTLRVSLLAALALTWYALTSN